MKATKLIGQPFVDTGGGIQNRRRRQPFEVLEPTDPAPTPPSLRTSVVSAEVRAEEEEYLYIHLKFERGGLDFKPHP